MPTQIGRVRAIEAEFDHMLVSSIFCWFRSILSVFGDFDQVGDALDHTWAEVCQICGPQCRLKARSIFGQHWDTFDQAWAGIDKLGPNAAEFGTELDQIRVGFGQNWAVLDRVWAVFDTLWAVFHARRGMIIGPEGLPRCEYVVPSVPCDGVPLKSSPIRAVVSEVDGGARPAAALSPE